MEFLTFKHSFKKMTEFIEIASQLINVLAK